MLTSPAAQVVDLAEDDDVEDGRGGAEEVGGAAMEADPLGLLLATDLAPSLVRRLRAEQVARAGGPARSSATPATLLQLLSLCARHSPAAAERLLAADALGAARGFLDTLLDRADSPEAAAAAAKNGAEAEALLAARAVRVLLQTGGLAAYEAARRAGVLAALQHVLHRCLGAPAVTERRAAIVTEVFRAWAACAEHGFVPDVDALFPLLLPLVRRDADRGGEAGWRRLPAAHLFRCVARVAAKMEAAGTLGAWAAGGGGPAGTSARCAAALAEEAAAWLDGDGDGNGPPPPPPLAAACLDVLAAVARAFAAAGAGDLHERLVVRIRAVAERSGAEGRGGGGEVGGGSSEVRAALVRATACLGAAADEGAAAVRGRVLREALAAVAEAAGRRDGGGDAAEEAASVSAWDLAVLRERCERDLPGAFELALACVEQVGGGGGGGGVPEDLEMEAVAAALALPTFAAPGEERHLRRALGVLGASAGLRSALRAAHAAALGRPLAEAAAARFAAAAAAALAETWIPEDRPGGAPGPR